MHHLAYPQYASAPKVGAHQSVRRQQKLKRALIVIAKLWAERRQDQSQKPLSRSDATETSILI